MAVTTQPIGASVPPATERWTRPVLAVLLSATAALYLWRLGAAGYANEFYAAAVQAGTQSWRALLFGSLDPGNGITVDKPPAALWVMALSGRIFGFNAWSMLVPQALMGVGSVAVLYAAVRRTSGAPAGLLAGTALALTPVAALMFRFNNPDALLVLLLVVAAYCVLRALDGNATVWTVLAGTALGLAFLTKLLQAFLVTPALALVLLIALPGGLWSRLRTVLAGLTAMVVSGGWFVVLVNWWPKDSRPYIGGSTDNSLLQLALGYNGIGRVFGGDGNPVGGPPGPAPDPGNLPHGGPGGPSMFGGHAGIARMFDASMGTEISWLLPAALIGLIAVGWFTRSAPRTDRTRAALLLWGGWLLVTAGVFSFMRGIMHPYYTVALAPAVAAVAAVSIVELWRRRRSAAARIVLAGMAATTGVWNFVLLARTPDWLPGLRWTLLIGLFTVAAGLLIGARRPDRYPAVLAAAALLLGLGGTTAYTLETVALSHHGPIPTSGPARPGAQFPSPGGPGGPPGPPQPADNSELDEMLAAADNRWAAATVGSHLAATLELRTGSSVMAIGGFSGGDNWPTLAQFQQYVATHQVQYFIEDGEPGRPGRPDDPGGRHRGPGHDSGAAHDITAWVKATFTPQQVGEATVYDLTG